MFNFLVKKLILVKIKQPDIKYCNTFINNDIKKIILFKRYYTLLFSFSNNIELYFMILNCRSYGGPKNFMVILFVLPVFFLNHDIESGAWSNSYLKIIGEIVLILYPTSFRFWYSVVKLLVFKVGTKDNFNNSYSRIYFD